MSNNSTPIHGVGAKRQMSEVGEGKKKKARIETSVPYSQLTMTLTTLPDCVNARVLSFLDIPSLHRAMGVSSKLSALCRHDAVWEDHLKLLLEVQYDTAYDPDCFREVESEYDSDGEDVTVRTSNPLGLTEIPTPISRRKEWKRSTELRRWMDECSRANVSIDRNYLLTNKAVGIYTIRSMFRRPRNGNHLPNHLDWIWRDVPLIDYYRGEALYAMESCYGLLEDQKDDGLCPDCTEPLPGDNISAFDRQFYHDLLPDHSQCRSFRDLQIDAFRELPSIQVLRMSRKETRRTAVGYL